MEKKEIKNKSEKKAPKKPKTHMEIEGIKAPLEAGKKYKYKIKQAEILIAAGAAKKQ